jgi:cobyrinic acid a,c-diamide synthase
MVKYQEKTCSIPRIVIAGTHSGCGKTTVSRGLMQAFCQQGLVVQPFKIGPDFIDPTHHTVICGRISRNLDPFMMGEDGVRETFLDASAGADIAVIEGVMGMFDGLDGSGISGTSHVMRILNSPALLVVDVRGMSRSAHALVAGYRGFEPDLDLAGVIFNRVGSARHRHLIERELSFRSLGFIPRNPCLEMESRHLGLRMGFEVQQDPLPGSIVRESCDLDGIRGIAESAMPIPIPELVTPGVHMAARIAVARDEAFCFYYQDNLKRLADSGAELVFFSPLRDPFPDTDGYYFGGGYPELHAPALEAAPCRHDLKNAADRGAPVFGECGGMMFLCSSITVDGRDFRMAGILPAEARMTKEIQALGYSAGVWTGGPGFARPGLPIRGHEFHYSSLDLSGDARFSIDLSRGRGILDGRDGPYSHDTVGTYTHSYFTSEFAASFVSAAARYRNSEA